MKWFSDLSIKHKASIIIIFASIVVFSAVGLLITIPLHSNALKDSSTMARLSAMETAARLSETINGTANIIRSSSATIADLSVSKIIQNENKREYLLNELLSVSLKKSNQLHNIWCTLEPNALDGMDEQFKNRMGSNSYGVFAPWILSDTILISEGDELAHYYNLPKQLKREVITDLYWDEVNSENLQMFSICVPIINSGKFLGVIGTDIYIKNVVKIFNELSLIATGKLVSDKGIVMVHNDEEIIGQLTGYGNKKILDELPKGEIIEGRFNYNGTQVYVVYIPIWLSEGSPPWYYAVEIPLNKIYAKSRKIVIYLMICCLVGSLLIAFVVWMMIKPMLNDVIGVTRIISRMSLGKNSQPAVGSDYQSNDELGRTRNDLRRLIAENTELKNKQREILAESNKLIQEVEIYKDLFVKTKTEQNEAIDHTYQQKRFDVVTIMFVEIQGLSKASTTTENTAKYMEKFDDYIVRFEKVVKKYKLVKLNGLGDNFVCAGGIPEKNVTNPITVILAAFEMLCIVEIDNAKKPPEEAWSLNISIHTGPVTALVGGQQHNDYFELKGDTMHEASRIASAGITNSILISANTYELVKELFDCHFSSVLPVKYHNKLDIFIVNGLKRDFASNLNKYLPNNAFRTQLMLVQFADLQEYILDKLETELSKNLYYHNVKHTVDVVTQSELIGWAEGLNDHKLLLLKTAALFHDIGHTVSYADHELRSTEIAKKILPKYDYKPVEIDEICRIIMATKLPPKPTDLVESIICDSDLDYLGRTDFVPVSNTLYEELKVQNKSLSLNDWNKMQLKFIGSHQYFTKTGRSLRNVKKQEQIERIKKLIE